MWLYGVIFLVVTSITGGVGYYINSLKNEIGELTAKVYRIEKDNSMKDVIILNKDNVIAIKDKEANDLIDTIDKRNDIITKNARDLNKSKLDIQKWMKLAKKKKFKYIYKYINKPNVDYRNANCKEGLELMKSFSNVKYEDL